MQKVKKQSRKNKKMKNAYYCFSPILTVRNKRAIMQQEEEAASDRRQTCVLQQIKCECLHNQNFLI